MADQLEYPTELEHEIVLKNGTELRLRRIRPEDALRNSLTRMAAALDGVITAGHGECNAGATERNHVFAPLAFRPALGWGAAATDGARRTVLSSRHARG